MSELHPSDADPPVRSRTPWAWVPTLYFAEGLPYVVVMSVSVIMYKRLGVSNTDIALYTSWLYLPWVVKPFWSPLVDVFRTKRFWIVTMQLLIGGGLAGVALTIPAPTFLQYTMAFLWLLAFSSATHDIAADGFYIIALDEHNQAWFNGIRSTCYRMAMITGQGLLVLLAGMLESYTGVPDVRVTVVASDGGEHIPFDPAAVISQAAAGRHDHSLATSPRLVAYPEEMWIARTVRAPGEVQAIIDRVNAWNEERGFSPRTAVVEEASSAPKTAKVEKSWPARLQQWLARTFGERQVAVDPDRAGNVGFVYFLWEGPPPTGDIGVNFGHSTGDKSIKLRAGERFVINQSNYRQPFAAAIQLDPNLTATTDATFLARSGNSPFAWSITFFVLATVFAILFAVHQFVLPRPARDISEQHPSVAQALEDVCETFVSFFRKRGVLVAILFLLFFRFSEAQLVKMSQPFLLDWREAGGLALTTGEVGIIYGTVGVICLTLGGLLGGFAAARHGLKYWLWWMVLAINLPNAAYAFLAYAQPESKWMVAAAVAVEQFGYGFGFTAYMLYMIYVSRGAHATVHYAICTGFMAFGMLIPGMFSGFLQEALGYRHFFVWVVLATVPCFVVTALIPLDPKFGKKSASVP